MASAKRIKRPLQNTINHHNTLLVHLVKLLNHRTTNAEELVLQLQTGGLIGLTNLVKILRVLDDGPFSPCSTRKRI
jgi:hypothetical protein